MATRPIIQSTKPETPLTASRLVVLAITCSLGPFATNGFVTSFPTLSELFGVPLSAMQEALTVYLLALAIGSLVVGALSDAYGRRPVLLAGMIVFGAATVGAVFATSLNELNAWRFVQGLGASVGQVITQAMVRDRWSGLSATRAMSIIGMLFNLSPALAPVVGGWLVVHASWESFFWFLLVYAVAICGVTIWCLDESLPVAMRRACQPRALATGYIECLKDKAFLFGVTANAANFMGMLLVVAGGADFVVNVLGFTVDAFAWVSIPVVFAAICGAAAAPPMLKRVGPRPLVLTALICLLAFEILMACVFLVVEPRYALAMSVVLVFQFVGNFIRPVVMVMNLDYHPSRRGMASSIQQSFMTIGFSLASSVLVPLCMGHIARYAMAMAISAGISLCFWLLSLRYREASLARLRQSNQ